MVWTINVKQRSTTRQSQNASQTLSKENELSDYMIESRIEHVRAAFSQEGIDAFLVLVEENRNYLSGFNAQDHQFDESAGALLITPDDLVLATDSRFEVQALQEAPLYHVVIYRKGLAKELPSLTKQYNIQRLGFESVRLSVKQYNEITDTLKGAGSTVELVPAENLVEGFREIKSPDEIQKTREALVLAEKAFVEVVRVLKPGMTEKSVAWAMEKAMREAGADSLSFPTIVAAGPNSALPHAIPSDRIIRDGEPVLFDWGARLNGYCSDISRTVVLGTPDETFLKVHQTVLEAQQRAIAVIKAGISSRAVDHEARDYIREQGFEGKFGHGLGHGTGLAVHEAPRLSPLKETTLQSGMIVTVEPGIYLPEWGGIRIENQVVVSDGGAVVLNNLKETYDIRQLVS
jgi:Xaa-Pro aminopeptidase